MAVTLTAATIVLNVLSPGFIPGRKREGFMESITERICKQVEVELQDDLDKLFEPIRCRAYSLSYDHLINTNKTLDLISDLKKLFFEQKLEPLQNKAIKMFIKKVESNK